MLRVKRVAMMDDYRRLAVFWAPEAGSALARWGAVWLGWCADAGEPQPRCQVGGLEVEALTAAPRRYGLHATLKAPFALAEGQSRWALEQAVEDFAAGAAAFELPRLEVAVLDGFVVLKPVRPSPDMARLAADCVCRFDRFRAPAPAGELKRRRAAGLSPAEEANLVAWGYPYVLGEFRFHITLTGRLGPDRAAATAQRLAEELAPLLRAPVAVREIALFGDPGEGAAFRLLERYALTGEDPAIGAATLAAIGPSFLTAAAPEPEGIA